MKIKFLTIVAALAMFSCGEAAEKIKETGDTLKNKVEAVVPEAVKAPIANAIDTGVDALTKKVEGLTDQAKTKGGDLLKAGEAEVENLTK